MDRSIRVVVGLLSLATFGHGQFDMAGMAGMAGMGGMAGMEGMGAMMGGEGGLAGLMNGGGAGLTGLMNGGGAGMAGPMGAMGGAGTGATGGPPGMAKIKNMIRSIMGMTGAGMGGMGGGGMMGNMVGMMIRPMITEIVAYYKMSEVSKAVLGPHAHPDAKMVQYAIQQGQEPVTMTDMLPYMNMLIDLSKKIGIYMPDGNIKKPLPDGVVATANAKGVKTKNTQPTLEEVRNIILKRSMIWYQASQDPAAGGAQAGPPNTNFAL